MTKILIMGKTGMLGSMLHYYFSNQGRYDVFTTSRDKSMGGDLFFDAEQLDTELLRKFISEKKISYLLNAIGIINSYCRDGDKNGTQRAILVNANFPHQLSNLAEKLGVRTIQIATDCVYDGRDGNYDEHSPHSPPDIYGKTKSLGEVVDKSVLNIRCSIIGPEIRSKVSLLEWFLRQDSEVKGFMHHKWNGVTTLRFAQLLDGIIQKELYGQLIKKSPVFHFVPPYTLTKDEMLEVFKLVFEKSTPIEPVSGPGPKVDRTLSTRFNDLSLFSDINFEEDVRALKSVMDRDFYPFHKG